MSKSITGALAYASPVGGPPGATVTASSLSSRAPSWLRCRELEQANADVAPRLLAMDRLDAVALRLETKRWIATELAFISNSAFTKRDAGGKIFAGLLGLAPRKPELGLTTLKKSGVDLPIHLSRLCEVPLLSVDQEQMLFQRMNYLLHQATVHRSLLNADRPSRARLELIQRLTLLAEWHRDRIVEANLRLVFSIIKKFVNLSNPFDDLLSDGIVGLIRAVEKFDYDRGFRFSTYATQVVRRNAYRTVVQRQQDRQKVMAGLQDLEIDVSDDNRASAITEKRWHELRSHLAVMLNDLDRREKLIVRARFSLGSHRKVHTLQALANRLGISKERVRQLEHRAMEKLRQMADNIELADLDA